MNVRKLSYDLKKAHKQNYKSEESHSNNENYDEPQRDFEPPSPISTTTYNNGCYLPNNLRPIQLPPYVPNNNLINVNSLNKEVEVM